MSPLDKRMVYWGALVALLGLGGFALVALWEAFLAPWGAYGALVLLGALWGLVVVVNWASRRGWGRQR